MGINKVNYGNTTLIDISNDTVTADKLAQGYTAHDNTGALITGTMGGSGWYTSTPTLFNNYNSTKGAGYAEYSVIGEPTAFIIASKATIEYTAYNNQAYCVMYNIYGMYGNPEYAVYYRYYYDGKLKATISDNPNGYIHYENGVLSVKLTSGIQFTGAASENMLIYIV